MHFAIAIGEQPDQADRQSHRPGGDDVAEFMARQVEPGDPAEIGRAGLCHR